MATAKVKVILTGTFSVSGDDFDEIRELLEGYSHNDLIQEAINADNFEVLSVATEEFTE